MKSHPVDEYESFIGMHSADPADRIENLEWSLLRNCYCDETGRIVRAHGLRIVTTAAALGIEADDGRTAIRSLHTYEGNVGENPDSRALCVVGSGLRRSKANDLFSRWDDIDFPTDIDTPALDRAAAGVFRDKYFYHQNGLDYPFRLKCEEDDPTATLTTTAETLGLKPPTYFGTYTSVTAGNGRRFPEGVYTSYAVTYVYGTRGESAPSPVFGLVGNIGSVTVDEQNFTNVPLGGTGVTARRIYRSKIGRGQFGAATAALTVNSLTKGAIVEMWLIDEIPNNTATTWTDEFDDAALDLSTRIPQPRPFPPIAQYQIMHLDRLFWAKLRQHPWTIGIRYDITRTDHTTTNARITISNTGNGTITTEIFYTAAWHNDVVVSNYKTKTLRAILIELMKSANTTLSPGSYTIDGYAANIQGQIDLDRTFTFKEVSQQAIYSADYWMTAIEDDATQGAPWYPNRFMWCDITFPEQVSWLNSADLTRHGSKRITNMLLMDNVLVIETDTDSWLISGTFIPDNFDVPSFEVHRSQASHGSICTRPDATVSIPDVGTLMVAHDALRAFRGESSSLAGLQVRNWFERILNEPVTRDFLVMFYHGGEIFIALSTYETR